MPTYAGFGPEAILSLDGSPLTSVEVSVYEDGTNTLATLYSSSVGGAQANPVSTDSYGNLVFWLEGGDYELEYNGHRVAFSTYVTDNVEHAAQHNAGEGDPISGLSPSQITGTAAILGANTFTGNQTLSNVNVVLGTTTGTKIGTATSQKLGFFNATPVIQQTGNALDALEALGLLASPTLAAADITGLGTMATEAAADYAALASANTFTAAQTIRSATYAKILLDGGSTSGNGPLIEFTSAGNAGELYGYAGRDGAINGGTGTDLLLYSVYGLKVQRGATTLARFGSASNTFTAFSASAVPVIAKGAAAQTANLQEWQDSSAVVLSSVASNGFFATSQAYGSTTAGQPRLVPGGNALTALTTNADHVPFVAKGATAQSANLTEWQDSGGTVLAYVGSTGQWRTSGTFGSTISGKAYLEPNYDTGAFGVISNNTANKGLVVRGLSAQTANLFEVQNDSGTALAIISAAGKITGVAATTSTATFNAPHGTAPSSPVNGDIWTTTSAVFAQINSTTKTLATTSDVDLKAPLSLTLNQQVASYSLVLADVGKLVEISNASANTLTVPLNSSQAFPVGTQINFVQTGAGQTTITPDGGVTINGTPTLKLRAQWSSVTLIKRDTDTWLAIGDLAAS